MWFSDAAIEGWRAAPRTTPGGQPWYSPLAILTALTLRAVFRLALRQTEGLIGSIFHLLGLALAVPDHTTLCRRAETLEVPQLRPRRQGEAVHLLVDSTGLKLCGAGEWLLEKHGTKTRRFWRKLHIGMDAEIGQIVAALLTTNDVDDGSQVGPLLDQVTTSVASFTADGAYDQEGVAAAVAERHPQALIIVPPRSTAVPSATAESAPTQRDCHLQCITKHGRAAWQKASGYTMRARAEATIDRFKQVISDGLRCRTDQHRATEVDVAVHALNRMLELGRPTSVRSACTQSGLGWAYCVRPVDPCNTAAPAVERIYPLLGRAPGSTNPTGLADKAERCMPVRGPSPSSYSMGLLRPISNCLALREEVLETAQEWYAGSAMRWVVQQHAQSTASEPISPNNPGLVWRPPPMPNRTILAFSGEELTLRLQQQELVARFGRFALSEDDLQATLDEACRVTAEGLKTNFAKVLEWLPVEGLFLARAGVGWRPGLIGSARIGADLASPCGYAFQTGKPVVSNHLEDEDRFRTPKMLVEHGIRRAINVLIGEGDARFGVLEADCTERGAFDRHDTVFLQSLANTLAAAVEAHGRRTAARESAATKDLLMAEVHHRVKNSLQLVQSMLGLQARAAVATEAAAPLAESAARVRTIAALHDRLYRTNAGLEVEVASYLEGLVEDLRASMTSKREGREIRLEAAQAIWAAAEVTTLGLVLTELVTNALKYGQGVVRVTFEQQHGGQAMLVVEDEGPGVPTDFDPARSRGLGMRLVTGLLSGHGGGLEIDRSFGHTRFIARLPHTRGAPTYSR